MSDNFGGYLPGPDSNDPLIPGILDRGHLPQEDLFENEPTFAEVLEGVHDVAGILEDDMDMSVLPGMLRLGGFLAFAARVLFG
ncbi:hypothetical protein AAVH_30487 [Aphelenchoides avenae]|nr:hypothetical protein AAVH_30487 [Aphelenchus avenae]